MPHHSALCPREKAEAQQLLQSARVDIPVQANGINDRTSSATDESKDSVGVQGDSIETCACVFPERQVAALVCHKDQLSQILLVFARHLNH